MASYVDSFLSDIKPDPSERNTEGHGYQNNFAESLISSANCLMSKMRKALGF